MSAPVTIGLEQARVELPRLVSQAQAGEASVITRHGRPCAAIVSVESLPSRARRSSLLALRGSGAGLWGPDIAGEIAKLRDEWA